MAHCHGELIQLNNPLWVDSLLTTIGQNAGKVKRSTGVELGDKHNAAFAAMFAHKLDAVTDSDGVALHTVGGNHDNVSRDGVGCNGVGRNDAGCDGMNCNGVGRNDIGRGWNLPRQRHWSGRC